MQIHDLEAFLAVAEELHFGRAAARLHIGQPPLSRTIKHLERELGEPLFERTTRSVRLTSAGEALVEPAYEVLESVRLAERAVKSAGRGETGLVRMGFAGPSSHVLVSRLSRMVQERHPGIELRLQSAMYSHAVTQAIIDGRLDLGIVRWTVEPPGIDHRVVTLEHLMLVVPSDHRLAGKRLVHMAELEGEPFVTLPADPGAASREYIIRLAHDAGFAPNIAHTAPETWTVFALVASGVGITISPDTAAANIHQEGISVVPLAEGRRPTYSRLAWRHGNHDPALREVLRASKVALPTPDLPTEVR